MATVWVEYGYSMRVPPSYLRDTEFALIYVNGENTLPNLRCDDENWKVVLTEEEFQKRMFEEE